MADRPDIEAYAALLIALSDASGQRDAFRESVVALRTVVENSAELRRFLADPTIRDEGKLAAMDRLLEGRFHPSLKYFLMIIQQAGVMARLTDIVESFRTQLAGRDERLTGELVSAHPLSDAQREAITREAGSLLGRRVTLEHRVDPSLIGGLRLRVGNLIIDDTVDNRLEHMRRQLQA